MKTVFTAHTLYTPAEEIPDPILAVEDGRITEVSSRSAREMPAKDKVVDFGDAILAPGFFDIHIHGGAGCFKVASMSSVDSSVPRPDLGPWPLAR